MASAGNFLTRHRALLRLVATVLFCSVAVVVVMGSLLSLYVARVVSSDALDAGVEMLSQTRTVVEFLLCDVEKTAYALGLNGDVERTLWAPWKSTGDIGTLRDIGQLFADRVSSSDYLESIALYVPKAGAVVTSSGAVDLSGYADRPVLEGFLSRGIRQSWIETRSVDEGRGVAAKVRLLTFALSVPVRSPTAEGVLLVNLKEDWFYAFAVSVNNPRLGSVAILDESGAVVSAQDPEAFAHSFGALFVSDPQLRGDRGSAVRDVGGRKIFLASITSTHNGWRYVTALPAARLYAHSRLVLWVSLAIAGANLLIAGALSIFASARYFRPVSRLVRMACGSGPAETAGIGADEFQLIGRSLTRLLEENEGFRREFGRNEIALREHFILNLLLGRLDGADVEKQAGYYGVELGQGPVLVMAARLHAPPGAAAGTEQEKNLTVSRARLLAQEGISPFARCLVVSQDAAHLVAILGPPPGTQEGAAKETARSVGAVLRNELALETSWGIGGRYTRLQDAHLSYREALEALAYERISGPGSIIAIQDVGQGHGSRAERAAAQRRVAELVAEAKVGNGAGARQIACALVDDMHANRTLGYQRKGILLAQLVDSLVRSALDAGLDPAEVFPGGGDPYHGFARLDCVEGMKEWIGGAVERMAKKLAERHGGRNRELIDGVISHLREHYREPVSIKQMADEVYLNPSYFCKIFREIAGTTFLDFVAGIRLERAGELLRGTRLPVVEVAEQSGFGTRLNLIRAFRRQIGMTPTEYRRQRAGERLSAADAEV